MTFARPIEARLRGTRRALSVKGKSAPLDACVL